VAGESPEKANMPRGVALNLLASALTILAAVALLASATLVGSAPLPAPPEPQTATVVRAFYAAVNDALRSGDTGPLERLVAPDVVLHGAPPGASPDLTGLERHLLAVHDAAPGTQLAVDELTVAGERAIVRLHVSAGPAARWLGLPLAAQPAWWGVFDAVHIEDGQVTALWTSLEQAPLLEPLSQIQLEPSYAPKQVTWERLRGAAGKVWSLSSAWQPRVLYVTAGALIVTVEGLIVSDELTWERPQPGTSTTVTAGEALLLLPAVRYTVRAAAGQADTEAFLLSFRADGFVGQVELSPNHPAFAAMAARANELERRLLASARTPELRRETLTVSFGRLTLPSGTHLALAETDGPLLLTVETGALGIEALHADPKRKETDPKATETIAVRLAPGEATIVPGGAITTLQAAGDEPVSVLAVTILPSETMTGAPA
jgi:predicted ester cyclase